MNTKVLIATDYYLPHWTGIVKGIHNLVSTLDLDFAVLTVRYKAELAAEETIGNAKIIRANPIFQLSRAAFSISAIFAFANQVKKVDTVLINSPCSNILPYSILAKVFNKKLVIFHQGDLKLRAGLKNRIIEAVFWFCTFLSCALADIVSSYTLDYAQSSSVLKHFPEKQRAMLMPILVQEKAQISPASISSILKEKQAGTNIVGFAGRFTHEKGFDVLFDAIPKVIAEIPNTKFVFAGSTDMGYENFFEEIRNKYENVKQQIILLGLLPEAELWSFYHEIDLCVISSRSDCFPLVQMEACLCGKPAVCTDIPGARYLVKHTGFGEICKSEDVQDLARALIKAIKNKDSYRNNFKNVQEYLAVDAALENAKKILT